MEISKIVLYWRKLNNWKNSIKKILKVIQYNKWFKLDRKHYRKDRNKWWINWMKNYLIPNWAMNNLYKNYLKCSKVFKIKGSLSIKQRWKFLLVTKPHIILWKKVWKMHFIWDLKYLFRDHSRIFEEVTIITTYGFENLLLIN